MGHFDSGIDMAWHLWRDLRKARKLYREGLSLWGRCRDRQSPEECEQARFVLKRLHNAIESQDEDYLQQAVKEVEERLPELCVEPGWKGIGRSVFFLLLAVAVIIPIRQMWFELYVIPTGSMRPTFKEQDRLVVSKTAFGINQPYSSGQLWMEPRLLSAGEIIVFGTDGIPLQDGWDRFLWFIPVRKQLVKRCMGLPGHTIYFYGGQIYAIDERGAPVESYREPLWVRRRDYIPLIRYEGTPRLDESNRRREVLQWQQPLAGWVRGTEGRWVPQICVGDKWLEDRGLNAANAYPEDGPQSYADFWGIRHHAFCRLTVEPAELKSWGEGCKAVLEVRHSPTLSRPRRAGSGVTETVIADHRTTIPLGQQEWDAMKRALYTARFVVKNGFAYRYAHDSEDLRPAPSTPRLDGVPDGTYEFTDGQALKIGFGGLTQPLPDNHPLYSDKLFPKLFNVGQEFHEAFASARGPMPSRWAYFRHGDLYVMGKMIWSYDSQWLKKFLERQESQSDPTVLPFKDWGAPSAEQIAQFGYKIPKDHLVALGDNHANSGDSREFGPVPIGNLLGSPSLLFWPWSEGKDWRLGVLPQPERSVWTLPNMLINGVGLSGLLGFELFLGLRRRRLERDLLADTIP
jgi:signal peptidase I